MSRSPRGPFWEPDPAFYRALAPSLEVQRILQRHLLDSGIAQTAARIADQVTELYALSEVAQASLASARAVQSLSDTAMSVSGLAAASSIAASQRLMVEDLLSAIGTLRTHPTLRTGLSDTALDQATEVLEELRRDPSPTDVDSTIVEELLDGELQEALEAELQNAMEAATPTIDQELADLDDRVTARLLLQALVIATVVVMLIQWELEERPVMVALDFGTSVCAIAAFLWDKVNKLVDRRYEPGVRDSDTESNADD